MKIPKSRTGFRTCYSCGSQALRSNLGLGEWGGRAICPVKDSCAKGKRKAHCAPTQRPEAPFLAYRAASFNPNSSKNSVPLKTRGEGLPAPYPTFRNAREEWSFVVMAVISFTSAPDQKLTTAINLLM
ncbi:hypothetical protein H8959_004901 [Pygathrix nigripes]